MLTLAGPHAHLPWPPFCNLRHPTHTEMADVIVVNSRFTAGVFARAFPLIWKVPQVVYPGIHVAAYDERIPSTHPDVAELLVGEEEEEEEGKEMATILSINRFERKKDLELAVHAFARLQDEPYFPRLRLVLAGRWGGQRMRRFWIAKEHAFRG